MKNKIKKNKIKKELLTKLEIMKSRYEKLSSAKRLSKELTTIRKNWQDK